jgi:hypothetical protein
MDEVVQRTAIENIGGGPVDCQIVVTGDGFAVVGQGKVEKVMKGKGKKRGRYKKIDDVMVRAATVLVAHGFRPLELMRLFQLPRRTSYRLEKIAREEIEKIMETSERKRREQERVTANVREEWESEPGKVETARGYSLREARSFKQ